MFSSPDKISHFFTLSKCHIFFYTEAFKGEQVKEDDDVDLERLDVPRSLLDTKNYCATLGHKGKLYFQIYF